MGNKYFFGLVVNGTGPSFGLLFQLFMAEQNCRAKGGTFQCLVNAVLVEVEVESGARVGRSNGRERD